MKTLIKTLASLTAGLVVGAVVVKRVSKNNNFLLSGKKIILDGKTIIEKGQRSRD